MDGIRNIIGRRAIPLAIGETAYRLTLMRLRDWADREDAILGMKLAPRELLADLPADFPADCRSIVEAKRDALVAAEGLASADDVLAFEGSFFGTCWRLARALRKHHPELGTIEAAGELICRAGRWRLGTILHALDRAEERDILATVFVPGAGDADGRVAWAAVFRALADRYGWTFAEIGKLTLYQAHVALGVAKMREDGRVVIEQKDLAEFRGWQARRKLARQFSA